MMNSSETNELRDPDVFSTDLHFCLLSEGLRSRRLRDLLRLARGNGELERIFETKVNEFRRYLRDTRVPKLWNLPIRISEWLTDHVRFTPPREALTTLSYVVFVLVVVDVAKSWLMSDRVPAPGAAKHVTSQRVDYDSQFDFTFPLSAATTESSQKVDDWLVKELKRAAESSDWQQLLTERIVSNVLPKVIDSEKTDEVIKRTVQECFASDEFQRMLSEAIQKSLVATKSIDSDARTVSREGNEETSQ